ncbi:hypothetical protein B566_EDAN012785 [Ephemera danica]|nr:hypothetical protein B566_EDAN012785 [Ephemera danica]
MSRAAKVTLGLAMAASLGTVGYVHWKQSEDRAKLHEGVLRDVERQQRRRAENIYILQQQLELTKQLRKTQE